MFVAEDLISKVADKLGKSVDEIRKINFLQTGDKLPYSMCNNNTLTDEHILPGKLSLGKNRRV